MKIQILGWACSLILCLTVLKQIHKQWSTRSSEGVSKWLYLGQIFAELGFVAYSWLVHNWVFVATNAFLLLSNFVGYGITLHQRRKTPSAAPASRSAA